MKKERRKLAAILLLAAIYFVTGKAGLALAYLHPSTTAIWPPAGISLAALLLFGYELWPGILLGAFLANLSAAGSPLVCLGIAVGDTLETLAGAWLVNHFAARSRVGGRAGVDAGDGHFAGTQPLRVSSRPIGNVVAGTQGIFQFSVLTGLLCTTIAATFGSLSLIFGGYLRWPAFGGIWTTWWLGDGVSNVLLAPLLILWISQPRLRWRQSQFFEAAALLGCLVLVGLVVFDDVFNLAAKNYPLEYLCIPFLLWAAYRFGPREASASTVILAVTAAWGTVLGFGPFARRSPNESLLLLQTFIGVVAVMTMGLSTAFAERRSAEIQARLLSVSDPLTGLGNYRKLIDTLEMEIKRSSRTAHPFAVLLLDLDGLKKINDASGHLTGSRALCRLASILRLHSRTMDTAARYGGDEFALILPEASAASARLIAERIAARTTGDPELPSISVSIGLAVYPQDGDTVEMLLNAADLALYQSKRRKHDAAAESLADLPPTARRAQ